MWEVVLVQEVNDWYTDLLKTDAQTAQAVAASIELLAQTGPTLGRPIADRIKGSALHNLKELRPGSSGQSEFRVLFVFDPNRNAVLLVAGDKAGRWSDWYRESIPLAERRYELWLGGYYAEEI